MTYDTVIAIATHAFAFVMGGLGTFVALALWAAAPDNDDNMKDDYYGF